MCTELTLWFWFKLSGGDPHASAQSASVILADPNTDVFHHLIKTYQGVADKYIESYLWVKKCIEKGSLVYTPLVYKNPGGRRPGEEYVSPAIHSRFHDQQTFLPDGHNLQNRTNNIYVTGLRQKFRTRKQVGGQATVYINNFVTL
jgi:hypothetical protein